MVQKHAFCMLHVQVQAKVAVRGLLSPQSIYRGLRPRPRHEPRHITSKKQSSRTDRTPDRHDGRPWAPRLLPIPPMLVHSHRLSGVLAVPTTAALQADDTSAIVAPMRHHQSSTHGLVDHLTSQEGGRFLVLTACMLDEAGKRATSRFTLGWEEDQ